MRKKCPGKREEGGIAESEARSRETLVRVEKRKAEKMNA